MNTDSNYFYKDFQRPLFLSPHLCQRLPTLPGPGQHPQTQERLLPPYLCSPSITPTAAAPLLITTSWTTALWKHFTPSEVRPVPESSGIHQIPLPVPAQPNPKCPSSPCHLTQPTFLAGASDSTRGQVSILSPK